MMYVRTDAIVVVIVGANVFLRLHYRQRTNFPSRQLEDFVEHIYTKGLAG